MKSNTHKLKSETSNACYVNLGENNEQHIRDTGAGGELAIIGNFML